MKAGKYEGNSVEVCNSNPNSNANHNSYKLLDRPTGQILHVTSDLKMAQFLHDKLMKQGYNIIMLMNK